LLGAMLAAPMPVLGSAGPRARSVDPSHHRGVVFWVPRRVCGACPSRPGRWCQAGRSWTTAAC